MVDKYRYCICLLVLFVGVLLGFFISGVDINYLSGWKDFFEIFSYIATISLAGFAIWTLDAWKNQFEYQKRFDILKELADSFEDLRVIFKHIKSMKMYYCCRASGMLDSEMSELLEDLERSGQAWEIAINNYQKVWKSSLFFISDDDILLSVLSPFELRGKVGKDLRAFVADVIDKKGPAACICIEFKANAINNELAEVFRKTSAVLFETVRGSIGR